MEVTYATPDEVESGFRTLTDSEKLNCAALLEEAAVIIDAYNSSADIERKRVASCRMVRRAIGSGDTTIPLGATQGTISALGYSQSWTYAQGTGTGELYLGKLEKKLLGVGNSIGSYSPIEGLTSED